MATVDYLARETQVAYSTAARAVETLAELGILREVTGRRRGRVFAYGEYLAMLSQGTEPL